MHSFLNIVTLFNGSGDRTIGGLSSVYDNIVKLEDVIRASFRTNLTKTQINDKKVLLKPNWVKHSAKINDEICLRTNDNFVLATLKVILEMNPSEVVIGDAPIQGCRWDSMISSSFLNEIDRLSITYNIPVTIKDFRRRRYNISDNNPESGIRPLSDYLIFDLGVNSFIEPVTKPGQTNFRVTNYDPDRMSSAHSPGVHKYCIAREFLNADIVISLPKIKTHQKTGITGALKNLVGINGDKDFLPHHRIGGTKAGGDCYPGGSNLRYWSELSLDKANRRQGRKSFWFWQKLSSFLWRLSFPGPEHNMAAGWHGNDTTWRMVMDLNKIAEYGNVSGTLSDKPKRDIFSLCDGIIAGQGNGPLEPEPLPLGIVSFTNNSLVNDRIIAILMDLPVDRIPLLRNNSYNKEELDCDIYLNQENITSEDLKQYAIKAIPPKGWSKYLNKKR
jgi:uncharacterized protein (DUF362 family)